MLFVELFVPRGILDDETRRRLGERIITEVVSAKGADPETIAAVPGWRKGTGARSAG
ncbi:MAG TPA: hypothetical protein VFS44_01525 [Gemmatimonadaceae bacterium]|nr:hypothetical protein [Gemmatimonadaceae bacterium]